MAASLPAIRGAATLHVDCARGAVEIAFSAPVGEDRAARIAFGDEHVSRELALSWTDAPSATAAVDDPWLLSQLAGHDGERLHVRIGEGDAASLLDFDLAGTLDAFAMCGLEVVPARHPEAWHPPPVEHEGLVLLYDPKVYRTRRRPKPTWPSDGPPLTEPVTCIAQIYLDETGTPFDVWVTRCEGPAREAVTKALWKWRWRPVVVDGEPVVARTGVAFAFIPD